jgi:hypothetical protein
VPKNNGAASAMLLSMHLSTIFFELDLVWMSTIGTHPQSLTN